jgi:response regulator RpfG family c-di-GMP phosphodiesterase
VARARPEEPLNATADERTPRILVADDDPSVREILKDFLGFEGFDVTLAVDGDDAWQRIVAEAFDLLVTDLEMPKRGGLQLLRDLQTLKEPPLAIMMTGYGTVESAIAAMKIGAYDYLLKPFRFEEVGHLIRKALEHRQLATENMRLQEAVALYAVGEALNQARDVDEIAQVLAAAAFDQFAPDIFAMWRLDGGNWHREHIRGSRDTPADLLDAVDELGSVELLKAFHSERPLVLSGAALAPFLPQASGQIHAGLLVPMRVQRRVTGVLGVFLACGPRTLHEGHRRALQMMADRAAVSLDNARLLEHLEQTFLQTIESLVSALEAKDEYTKGHSERVMQWALILGGLMKLGRDEMENLRRAALLHDIGKIGLDLSALQKPQPLSAEEYERFKLHPVLGKRILEPIEFLRGATPAVLHHHEHWDGQGYPLGLAGEEIPLGGRILGIADAFEVMVTDRVYRQALSLDEARAELQRCAGKQFDPTIIARFLDWLAGFDSLADLPVAGGRRLHTDQPAEAIP